MEGTGPLRGRSMATMGQSAAAVMDRVQLALGCMRAPQIR